MTAGLAEGSQAVKGFKVFLELSETSDASKLNFDYEV